MGPGNSTRSKFMKKYKEGSFDVTHLESITIQKCRLGCPSSMIYLARGLRLGEAKHDDDA
jgi:hypothetical protein